MFPAKSPLPSFGTLWSASKEDAIKTARNNLELITGKVCVEEKFLGSAFLYGPHQYMLTCKHVVIDNNEIRDYISIHFPSSQYTVGAQVVDSDPFNDIALLKLICQEHPPDSFPFPILASPGCGVGEVAFCGGFSLGTEYIQVTDGVITNSDDPRIIVVTNITDHGTSGGACIGSSYRNLIGIIREDYGSKHHRTALIPSLLVDNFLRLSKVENVPQLLPYD